MKITKYDILLKLMFSILKIYIIFTMIGLFCLNGYVIHTGNLKQALDHGLVLKRYVESLNLIKKLAKIRYYGKCDKQRYQTCNNWSKKLFSIRTKLSYNNFFFLCKFISHISEKEKNMNKSVCLGLSILEICNILMWEFWYDFVKPKYGEKAKLYDMDTDSYIVYIKTEDIYPDIEKDVETRFDTSNYELDRPLSKGKK